MSEGLEFLDKYIHVPQEYSREELSTMVWDYYMTPDEIQEAYGKNEAGQFKYSLEQIGEDLMKWNITPNMVPTFGIAESITSSIDIYNQTIAAYTEKGAAKFRNIKKIVKFLGNIKAALEQDSKDPQKNTLKENLYQLFSLDISMNDLIKHQQEDEKIRMKYFKLRQDEIKLLHTVLKTIVEAVEADKMLASMFEELSNIDKIQGTSYSAHFIDNVQRRFQDKLEKEPLIQGKKISALRRDIGGMKPAKPKIRKKQQTYQSLLRETAKTFGVHHTVAQAALKLWKDKKVDNQPTIELSEAIKTVIPELRAKYSWIAENGKHIDDNIN